jgi:uncharacterized protein
VQTIAALYWPHGRERYPSTSELVELPDGDKLSLVWSTPPGWQSSQPTVVLVHGLCGCSRSPYMSRMAGKLYRRGVRAVRVNLRGCGSGIGWARHPYHSGRSEDVRHVLEWLARETPESPVTLIGFSLGGNIVLKLAGEDADHPTAGLSSVIAVSAPIDLSACSRLIEERRNRIYQEHFVRRLRADVGQHARLFPDLPAPELPRRLSLRLFDDCYTAPRSGFRDAHDYYTRAASGPLIPKIAVPALLLASRDDPFIAATPFEQLPPLRNVEVRLTDHGGHLGFLGFAGHGTDFRWMDQQLLDWIDHHS